MEEETRTRTKSKKRGSSTLTLIILGVIVVALAIASMYFYLQYQKIKKNPQIVAKQETDALVEQVSKLIDLPKDETPTVATVLDKEKLKDQPFFNNAQNGDKILIYTKAKKAIIYRPKDHKLINVGPIAIDQKAQVAVALVNAGGDVSGVEKTINDKFAGGVAIANKSDVKSKNSVKKTIVVDVSGQNGQIAQQIAEAIGAEVGSMPAGEPTPQGAAIVVFVK